MKCPVDPVGLRILSTARRIAKKVLVDAVHARNERERERLHQLDGLAPAAWGATIGDAGNLVIGGVDVADLAGEYGTPLHVVNHSRLLADYERFDSSFRSLYPKIGIGYSYKTNPLPGVIKVLHGAGALAEVISHFELWLAIELGVPAQRIIFNGPGKTRDAIELAVNHGIGMINIDSLSEIDEIARAARTRERKQSVGVRVITSVGWSSQFGLSIASGHAMEAFRALLRHPQLKATGLHFHLGTGIRDVALYLQAVRETLEFAQVLHSELGIQITQLDLGGGFGVPTVRPFTEWDTRLTLNGRPAGPVDVAAAAGPADYARGIVELVTKYYPADAETLPTMIFEPGRAITSSAQCLVLRVLAVKDNPAGVRSVILDGGKNIAMPLGYEIHELLAVNNAADARVSTYNFYGPLCHPGDLHFQSKTFRTLKAGDLVAIMDAGAYFIPNQMNFSHPRPPVVIVNNGGSSLLRQRESFDDIVRLDQLHAEGTSSRESGTKIARFGYVGVR
jgi:diaminopimelate decarboxylase